MTPNTATVRRRKGSARARRRPPILRTAAADSSCDTYNVGFVDTRLGRVWAAVSRDGLVAVTLPGEAETTFRSRVSRVAASGDISDTATPVLRRALAQIAEFLAGKRRDFDLPLDVRATPFTKKVLEALARVPFGKTLTYGELAKSLGSPRASRAVGLALSKNPIPIVLPCHRIIASGGGLGGFAGKARALDMKRELLKHEGVDGVWK